MNENANLIAQYFPSHMRRQFERAINPTGMCLNDARSRVDTAGLVRLIEGFDRAIAALSQPAIPKTLGDTVALIVRDVCELEYPAHPDKPMLLTVSVNELSEILMDRLSQDATIQQATDSGISRIYEICNRYESGYGHGLKRDGLDLSKTPHSDAELGEAYQIGYEAGSERFDAHPQPATQQAVFEGWVKSIISTENHEYALSRDKSGTYACPGTQIRWHAWQAAIAHAHPQPAAQPQPDKAELTDDEVCEWILKQWEMFYGLRANPKMPPDIDYEFISAVIAADRALLNTGEAK